jgi:hypothetical protein
VTESGVDSAPHAAFPHAYSPAMKVIVDQDFPATPDRLWAAFSDPDYPRAKYVALGAIDVDVRRFSATETLIEVELSRRIPVDTQKIPAFARKLVGTEQTMVHETRWRRVGPSEVLADLTITAVGRPVRMGGSARLGGRGDGASRLRFEIDVTSDVPLIGGKVEALFASQVEAALAADHGFTLGYLAARGA